MISKPAKASSRRLLASAPCLKFVLGAFYRCGARFSRAARACGYLQCHRHHRSGEPHFYPGTRYQRRRQPRRRLRQRHEFQRLPAFVAEHVHAGELSESHAPSCHFYHPGIRDRCRRQHGRFLCRHRRTNPRFHKHRRHVRDR